MDMSIADGEIEREEEETISLDRSVPSMSRLSPTMDVFRNDL